MPKATSLVLLLAAASALAQNVPNVKDALRCPNSPDGSQPYRVDTTADGAFRRIGITDANAVCNDGSPALMYVRPARPGATEPGGSSANRWLIHLLGGSSCSTYEECAARWCGIGQWEGTLMTTAFSGPTRNADGLLGRNAINRLGDRNLVIMKYCSSDNWQGRKSDVVLTSEADASRRFSLHFQGATIVNAALTQLLQGVPGLPRLSEATDVLFSGDSAGSVGARAHLDRVAARLLAINPAIRVRGNLEAAFEPDLNGKQGFPAGDPNDPVYARKNADYQRVQVNQRNASLDDSCLAAHPSAPYLCADNGYLTLNHLTTPFFQILDIQDPLMVNGFLENGFQGTPAELAQGLQKQLTALANLRDTALERNLMSLAPGVGGRNCAQHVTYGNDDGFLGKRLRAAPNAPAYSYYELLWNWLHGLSPSVIIAPEPPPTPANPAEDAICAATAPNAPAPPSLATISSASYARQGPVAPESIVATFGAGLAAATATATAVPWPTSLGGIQITVTDSRGIARPAPLYFVSPLQLLYLIPAGTAPGPARLRIGSQESSVEIAPTAPGIYTANQAGTGVAAGTWLRVTAQGARTEGLLFDPGTRTASAVPLNAADQLYLILYGTGLRGGPATATIGDIAVPVAGPVAQGQYPGLDQINLGPVPLRAGHGSRQIVLRQGDALANPVTVTFRLP